MQSDIRYLPGTCRCCRVNPLQMISITHVKQQNCLGRRLKNAGLSFSVNWRPILAHLTEHLQGPPVVPASSFGPHESDRESQRMGAGLFSPQPIRATASFDYSVKLGLVGRACLAALPEKIASLSLEKWAG